VPHTPFQEVQSSGNPQGAKCKVQVAPLEATRFTAAKAGVNQRRDERLNLSARRCLQEPPDL
jgi:hypothetical protein